ncbi:MAG: Uncharacterised protein [Marinobacterium sp. xm-d-530]|nr:MAG: Uncharacterised protein [Marinobacterium sp. xm-d-530]
MDNLLFTLRKDGSVMCAEDHRGLLCFKIDSETHEQWMLRCAEIFRLGSLVADVSRLKR